jgi:hypothetical protein
VPQENYNTIKTSICFSQTGDHIKLSSVLKTSKTEVSRWTGVGTKPTVTRAELHPCQLLALGPPLAPLMGPLGWNAGMTSSKCGPTTCPAGRPTGSWQPSRRETSHPASAARSRSEASSWLRVKND